MGGKRSKFFSTMASFFTNDQKGKPVKKTAPARKTKSQRNRDILTSSHVPHIASKPNHHLHTIQAKPGTSTEIIDLTSEETNQLFPIKIHILDDAQNTTAVFLEWEVDPLKSTDDSNTSQCFSVETIPKPEKSSEDDILGTILLKNEQSVDNSISVENMFVENQIDAFKNDVALLKQSICDEVDLSLSCDGNKGTSCTNDRIHEIEDSKKDFKEKKNKVYEAKKSKKGKKKRDDYHASKIIKVKGSDSYFCSLCEVQLKEMTMVRAHLKKYKHVTPSFSCNVCDKRFQWKGCLILHLKEHFADNDLEANMMLDQTKTDVSIKPEPELDISKFLDFTKVDHETFNNLEQKLKSNSSVVHSSLIKLISDTDREEMNLACGYCDQCFDSQISLVEHCRTHMTDRPFMCNICGSLFKSNISLVYHTRIHFRMIRNRKKKAPVPFIKYILKLHSCNECDRSYVSWSALNQHKRNVHHATAEHVCETCGRMYVSKGHLKQHVYRYCGSKKTPDEKKVKKGKFNCKICDKRFYKDTTLRKHELKAHL